MRRISIVLVLFAAAVSGVPAKEASAVQTASRKGATTNTSDQGESSGGVQLQVPERRVWLGTVRLPVAVMADGQRLPAGTYRVRLTGESAGAHTAAGQSHQLERWVEFVQGRHVRGRAMAPVVPSGEAKEVAESALPALGTVRIQPLKENDYYRLWFNYRGDQVLIYLPIA